MASFSLLLRTMRIYLSMNCYSSCYGFFKFCLLCLFGGLFFQVGHFTDGSSVEMKWVFVTVELFGRMTSCCVILFIEETQILCTFAFVFYFPCAINFLSNNLSVFLLGVCCFGEPDQVLGRGNSQLAARILIGQGKRNRHSAIQNVALQFISVFCPAPGGCGSFPRREEMGPWISLLHRHIFPYAFKKPAITSPLVSCCPTSEHRLLLSILIFCLWVYNHLPSLW